MKVEKTRLSRRLRNYFVTGLLVLVPISLTLFIINYLFLKIDSILRDVIYKFFRTQLGLPLGDEPIPGLGFITLILLILVTGLLARNYLGNKIIQFGELILARIPIISRIYSTIQQISQAFLSEKREVFKKPVLFEYPRRGIYSIGFYTQDTRGPVQDALDEDVVSVFLPTTPNPTSGFLLFVPKTDIIDIDLSVEEAMKLVISGGAIIPQNK
ncbi:MAG: DUF502 domain-containing protein [candidate division KSB1 bacterium]|nr:DUF502 domain-containing protein [candidate division KSB1 bacterium]MDQ7064764.1 DUF502 domain-containing protein [candidate division KSB1 bacterium]